MPVILPLRMQRKEAHQKFEGLPGLSIAFWANLGVHSETLYQKAKEKKKKKDDKRKVAQTRLIFLMNKDR